METLTDGASIESRINFLSGKGVGSVGISIPSPSYAKQLSTTNRVRVTIVIQMIGQRT